MNLQYLLRRAVLIAFVAAGLVACGGGGGGGSSAQNDPPTTPPPTTPPPSGNEKVSADFYQMAIDVLTTGATTLPDGETYDGDTEAISLSDYDWSAAEVDEDTFDQLLENL